MKKTVKKKKKVVKKVSMTTVLLNIVGRLEKLERGGARTMEAVIKDEFSPNPENHMKLWTPSEDYVLAKMMDNNDSLKVMARKMGRTRFSVFMRLVKNGKITEHNCYTMWYGALTNDEIKAGYRQWGRKW